MISIKLKVLAFYYDFLNEYVLKLFKYWIFYIELSRKINDAVRSDMWYERGVSKHRSSHSLKKLFLKISQSSRENICARAFFLYSCRPQPK